MSDNTNNGFPVPEEPLTREEEYLSAIAGVTASTEIPEKPLTRVEAYLNKIVENGGGGGGGGFTPTDAQLDAMNSGITSEDVEQISTNKNNILFLNATAEITGWHKADVMNRLAFDYAFSYDGTENVEYGFLYYRNGILNLDMTFVAKNMIPGIGSTTITSPTGIFRTSDNGNGIYLRPYIKIGARYKYGEQVFTNYTDAPNQ